MLTISRLMRGSFLLYFLAIGASTAYADPNWSTDLSASRATTLTCKGNGNVGIYYAENNGFQTDKGCSAHCDWSGDDGKKASSDFTKHDIAENFKGAIQSITLDFAITDSQNAKLSCDN